MIQRAGRTKVVVVLCCVITDGYCTASVCISEEDKKRTTQLVFHYKEGKEV